MKFYRLYWVLLIHFAAVFSPLQVQSAEISIPVRQAIPGSEVNLPVVIDVVENLAAAKMVISYDTRILEFKKAKKTEYTSAMMHIVNDKKPGTLIVVLAGAMGISGRNIPLVEFIFAVNRNSTSGTQKIIDITDVQMMNAQLKYIKCVIRVNSPIFFQSYPDCSSQDKTP